MQGRNRFCLQQGRRSGERTQRARFCMGDPPSHVGLAGIAMWPTNHPFHWKAISVRHVLLPRSDDPSTSVCHCVGTSRRGGSGGTPTLRVFVACDLSLRTEGEWRCEAFPRWDPCWQRDGYVPMAIHRPGQHKRPAWEGHAPEAPRQWGAPRTDSAEANGTPATSCPLMVTRCAEAVCSDNQRPVVNRIPAGNPMTSGPKAGRHPNPARQGAGNRSRCAGPPDALSSEAP
jgi:hypothetical protein